MTAARMVGMFILHSVFAFALVAGTHGAHHATANGVPDWLIENYSYSGLASIPGLLLASVLALRSRYLMAWIGRLADDRANDVALADRRIEALPPFAFAAMAGICAMVLGTGLIVVGDALGTGLPRHFGMPALIGPLAALLMGITLLMGAILRRR